ncbi:MAG: glycoside hydrolase family 9 protein, partial [Lachnospiraceae bacterium]
DILDEVRYEAGHLLKMQDTKTGAVLRGTKTVQTSADYAALMANFYHFYKNYDAKFARTCLQSGARAWQYVIGNSQEEPYTDDIYYAATSLYRASGNEKYHAYIKKYHQQTQTQTQIKQIDANSRELYADMAYLMTRQKVDVAICRDLMSKWMDYVETIVAKAQNSSYLSSADEVNQILSDMLCLSIVGHVITNHEYTTVLENHLHYFLGRNAEGVSYIDGFGSRMADTSEMITKQPQLTSMLLFMLGELNNIEMEMEES